MALFPIEHAAPPPSEGARQSTSSWIEGLARLGYAAKGVVYVVVGLLAAQAAVDATGSASGSEGALATILRQPLGRFLLAIVAIGLIGYALWRFVQAALDPEHKGNDTRGIAVRLALSISGVVHLGLAIEAARAVLRGAMTGGSGEDADHWTALLMRQPLGAWIAGAVGLGIAAYGLYQLYKAYAVELSKWLDLSTMGSRAREWTVRFARLGLAARGIVFGVIGALLVQAAMQHDPGDAVGVGGALRMLQQQPYGPWLLGGVAAGLIAYGLFELVKARYRQFKTS